MAQAVICPVCDGMGKKELQSTSSSTVPTVISCIGCNGRGWVAVGDYGCSPHPDIVHSLFTEMFEPKKDRGFYKHGTDSGV